MQEEKWSSLEGRGRRGIKYGKSRAFVELTEYIANAVKNDTHFFLLAELHKLYSLLYIRRYTLCSPTSASPVWGGLPIYLEEDLQRVQNRCLNVIGLPRDTVESLVTRRQNLKRKEFKRILESEAHPCKRFLDKPVDHGHNLRSCKTNPAHLRIPVLHC